MLGIYIYMRRHLFFLTSVDPNLPENLNKIQNRKGILCYRDICKDHCLFLVKAAVKTVIETNKIVGAATNICPPRVSLVKHN